MRETTFPFATFRDWGDTPVGKPQIDVEALSRFSKWQQEVLKRPILDEITGNYGFNPTKVAFYKYVDAAAKKSHIKDIAHSAEEAKSLIGKRKRQRRAVALSAESAIAKYLSIAVFREKVLEEELDLTRVGGSQDISKYSADAIADYGHCILNLVDKRRGGDFSEGLKGRIHELAPDIGANLQLYGNYAIDHPEVLREEYSVPILQATRQEQVTRINYWQPRHEAVMTAFPTLHPSEEMATIAMPLADILKIPE